MTLDRRYTDADSLEDFLGVPRGGHRDPSPGEAMPRWPDTTRIEQQMFAKRLAQKGGGKLIETINVNFATGEITYTNHLDDMRNENKNAVDAILPPPDDAQS